MVDLTSLRYFAALVECGSTVAASKRLHVSQSALSRSVVNLEKRLGVQLYHRGADGVRLTPAGTALYGRALEMLKLADSIEGDISSQAEAVRGDVYLGVGEMRSLSFLSQVMGEVRSRYPFVQFHVRSGAPSEFKEDMARGRLDFCLQPLANSSRDCETVELPMPDSWCIAMREDAPLSPLSRISPADLRGKPIMFSSNIPVLGFVSGWMGDAFDPDCVVATFSLALDGQMMAGSGFGYAFTYEGLCRCDGVVTRPLTPAVTVPAGLVRRKGHYLNRACQVFLEAVRERACAESSGKEQAKGEA